MTGFGNSRRMSRRAHRAMANGRVRREVAAKRSRVLGNSGQRSLLGMLGLGRREVNHIMWEDADPMDAIRKKGGLAQRLAIARYGWHKDDIRHQPENRHMPTRPRQRNNRREY